MQYLVLGRNLIVVSSRSNKNPKEVFVSNRTDKSDLAPRAVIAGPKTGILRIRHVDVDAAHGEILVAVRNNIELYLSDAVSPSPWNPDKLEFIGVWNISDNGDVIPEFSKHKLN